MSVSAATQMPAVQPVAAPEPADLFVPVVEPTGESMRSSPGPTEVTAKLAAARAGRLVPVAAAPGVIAAAYVPQPELEPAELLVEMADRMPLTHAYLARVLGWDGKPAADPLAEFLSDRAVRLLDDTDAVLARAGLGGERLWH